MNKPEGLKSIIFLDIETVPEYQALQEAPVELQAAWDDKLKRAKKRKPKEEVEDNPDFKYENAGLVPEFGRIICLAIGRYDNSTEDSDLIVKSMASDNEVQILKEFASILTKYKYYKLCAYNGKNFDIPFIGKRMLIHKIPLPPQLAIMGLKPWEVPHIDPAELWNFGARSSSFASLKELCAVFGIPSPKDDISGEDVRKVYYEEKDLPRIANYCEKDVQALAKVYKRMLGVE